MILRLLEVGLSRYRRKNVYSHALKLGLCISHSIFRTLDVIVRRIEVRLPRYGQKRLFTAFEIVLIAFAFVFLEHWKLFCVDWRYGCQDMGKNVSRAGAMNPFKRLLALAMNLFKRPLKSIRVHLAVKKNLINF